MAVQEQVKSTCLNERQVSERTGLALSTLRNWRVLGKGPEYVKLGSAVRYPEDALERFLESRRVAPEEAA